MTLQSFRIQDLIRSEWGFCRVKLEYFEVSIQGSFGSYSTPRKDLSPEYYSKMEVAIFHKDGTWAKPKEDPIFMFYEWRKYFEPGDKPVAGYVDVRIIEQIVEDLNLYVKINSL